MGEMADLAIEQGMYEEEYREEHPEEFEDENNDVAPSVGFHYTKRVINNSKVCRNCGKDGFHWQEAETGWRLFDKDNKIHNCNKKKNNPQKKNEKRTERQQNEGKFYPEQFE